MSLLRRLESMEEQQSSSTGSQGAFLTLKDRIQQRLISELDSGTGIAQTADPRSVIRNAFENILDEEGVVLSRPDRQRLLMDIEDDILGFGPLERLLQEDGIAEIMVNGPSEVYVERRGRIERVATYFDGNSHLLDVINRILAAAGRSIDSSSPMIETRLNGGIRVNIVLPPLTPQPKLSIRRRQNLTFENLIQIGSITQEALEFLRACIIAKINIIIAGLVHSGKTTLLNLLSRFIPADERIITIEHVIELLLPHEHTVMLEHHPGSEERDRISVHDLVSFSQHMRPDRILLGEIRPGMYRTLSLAANLSHGIITTMNASSPRAALRQLEEWALDENPHLPIALIREQLLDSVDLIVHVGHMDDGERRTLNVTEVADIRGDEIETTEIFRFERTGMEGGRIIGRLRPTGTQPKLMVRLQEVGMHLPPSIFGIGRRRPR